MARLGKRKEDALEHASTVDMEQSVTLRLEAVLEGHRAALSERLLAVRAAAERHDKAAAAQDWGSKRWLVAKHALAAKLNAASRGGVTAAADEAAHFEVVARRLVGATAAAARRKRARLDAAAPVVLPSSVGVRLALERMVAGGGASVGSGDACDDCGAVMKIVENDSLLACPACAKTRVLPMQCAGLAGDAAEFVGGAHSFSQKNRLVEWLELAQAKEYTEPPPGALASVMAHMVAKRATGLEDYAPTFRAEREARGPFKDVDDVLARMGGRVPNLAEALEGVSATLVRASMQSLAAVSKPDAPGLRKCYEHAAKHAAYMTGLWPPRMHADQEEQLRRLYATAAPVYARFKKPSQPSLPLGYPYFLRCVCILLGLDEFIAHFPLPPGARTVEPREAMRRELWTELGWECVPSVAPLPPITMADGRQLVVTETSERGAVVRLV